MRVSNFGLAFVVLASTSFSTLAATTADDAAKLQATLQTYLGSGADAVKITPDGDGFKAELDFAAIVPKGVPGSGATVTPIDVHIKPEGNGKWKITRDGAFSLSAKVPGQLDLTESFGSLALDAEFDEALGAFSSFTNTAKDVTFSEDVTDSSGMNIKADGKFDSMNVTGTAVANPAGGVDIKFSEPIGAGNFNETIISKDQPPIAAQVKFDGGNFDGSFTGMKSRALLDVLKFMVAHQDQAALAKDQPAFKPLLTALLPVFANGKMAGSIDKVEVQTPMGPAGAAKVNIGMDVNGVVKDGKFNETIGVEGLTLPPGLVPPWGAGLVPKNVSFGFTVSGFDLDAVANADIADADFSKNPPLPTDQENKMMALLMPKGTVDITFDKTGLSNETYTIAGDAAFTAGPSAVPSGKAHITAKGLDEIMKIVQASPPEAGLQQGAAMIIGAKGMGKAESDGSMSWDIQATPDGKILVNNVDVSKLSQPQQ